MKLLQNGWGYVPQLPDQYTILPGSQHGLRDKASVETRS